MGVLVSPVFADNSPGAANQVRDFFDYEDCWYWYGHSTDSDSDGLTDCEEYELGTDPTKKDTDGDTISDWQETVDKSSPLDRGSYLIPLDTTVCSEWNGFLEMWNIFEHVNMRSSSLGITTTLYDINGIGVSDQSFGIANGAQYDLLVHDMPGHTTNSYGAVCSSHNGGVGDMDGRMVYYKQDTNRHESWRGHFQFALAMPMSNGRPRKQFVPFNTYRIDGLNTLVANWIQLTNLSSNNVRGTLSFRAMDGSAFLLEIGYPPLTQSEESF
jgi:hypothetical protein